MDGKHNESREALGHRSGHIKGQPDWMPDPGVHQYVYDLLEEFFNVDVCRLDDRWIPLTIVGTFDWLMICGWWLVEYTGIFDTYESYKWVFDYDGYEFDPDQLLVFRDHPEENAFDERWNRPGLTTKERTEVIQFILQDIFRSYDVPAPPQEILEKMVWGTLIWTLSDYGKDWLHDKDVLFACVYDFSVAYMARWDGELLDPKIMVRTKREVGSCRNCGEKLWCVKGYVVEGTWQYHCNACAVNMQKFGVGMDERDNRLITPLCGHQTCIDTRCPHTELTEEDVKQQFRDAGTEKLENWRQSVNQMGGRTPRQLAGQSIKDIVDYFGRPK